MLEESDRDITVIHQFGLHSAPLEQNWGLQIHCNMCKNFNNPPIDRYKNNSTCLECVLLALITEKNKILSKIEFEVKLHSPSKDLQLLAEIKETYQRWRNYREILYSCQNIDCFISSSPDFATFFYQILQKMQNLPINLCENCTYILKEQKFLNKELKNTEIFSIITKMPPKYNWLEIGFIGPYYEGQALIPLSEIKRDRQLISYEIPSFPLYIVSIYSNQVYENNLKITPKFGAKSAEFYDKLVVTLGKMELSLNFDHLLPIGTIVEKYISYIGNYLKIHYHNLDNIETANLALFVSVQKLNISKLFPLLIDEYIDEIYLDSPHNSIYIDHRDFGRCITSIQLTDQDIDSLKTFLRISSNKRLDSTTPYLKCSIHNSFFHCRFAVDISPGVLSGFSLDIRKMNRKTYTLPELISRGMLPVHIAAFLYVCVLLRINITTVGETNTGKTTLINSLDLLAPSHFRKIYIEESHESLDQPNSHQLKYTVDSAHVNHSKTTAIYYLLHRNPDLVYLGEILTKEEAHAMFHCLSAGLRGFQTIHAQDLGSILNRWQYHFEIDPACYNDLGLLILLKKNQYKRYISEIAEISSDKANVFVHPIITYDPDMQIWSKIPNLGVLRVFTKMVFSIKDIEFLNRLIRFYEYVFESLNDRQKWNMNFQVQLFQSLYNQIETMRREQVDIQWEELKYIIEQMEE